MPSGDGVLMNNSYLLDAIEYTKYSKMELAGL